MKKRILCLVMMVLLVFVVPQNAFAETYEGSKDWIAHFTGDELASNFTSAQIAESVLNMQPGDDITLYVKVRNDYKETVDWYMTNEVLRTLEESNNCAEGGAYTYILKYHNPEGEELLLYSSDVVGGEEDTSLEGEGLHQATNGLENYFYLDRFAQGEEAWITLYVKLDGETQGNDYQDTLAVLQLRFAVELVNIKTGNNIIKTGDETPIVIYSAVTLVSGLALLAMAVTMMKRRSDEKGE